MKSLKDKCLDALEVIARGCKDDGVVFLKADYLVNKAREKAFAAGANAEEVNAAIERAKR